MPKYPRRSSERSTPVNQNYIWNKLGTDLHYHIIRFITHYRIWNHGYDGRLYHTLSCVSKSICQWVQKNAWNFAFYIKSVNRSFNLPCNSLCTRWEGNRKRNLYLRTRIVSMNVAINLTLKNFSHRLEHLKLIYFYPADLRIL